MASAAPVCSSCHCLLKQRRTLTCFHSFCPKCVIKLKQLKSNTTGVICAVCLKFTPHQYIHVSEMEHILPEVRVLLLLTEQNYSAAIEEKQNCSQMLKIFQDNTLDILREIEREKKRKLDELQKKMERIEKDSLDLKNDFLSKSKTTVDSIHEKADELDNLVCSFESMLGWGNTLKELIQVPDTFLNLQKELIFRMKKLVPSANVLNQSLNDYAADFAVFLPNGYHDDNCIGKIEMTNLPTLLQEHSEDAYFVRYNIKQFTSQFKFQLTNELDNLLEQPPQQNPNNMDIEEIIKILDSSLENNKTMGITSELKDESVANEIISGKDICLLNINSQPQCSIFKDSDNKTNNYVMAPLKPPDLESHRNFLDFLELKHINLTKVKKSKLEDECLRFCFHNDLIWCPCRYEKRIDIYTMYTLHFVKSIEISEVECPKAIHPYGKSMLVAGSNGLFMKHIEKTDSRAECVVSGFCWDVHACGQILAVLQTELVQVQNANHPVTTTSFAVPPDENTILTDGQHIFVSFTSSNTSIRMYGLKGEKLRSFSVYDGCDLPVMKRSPLLCGTDVNSTSLLCVDHKIAKIKVLNLKTSEISFEMNTDLKNVRDIFIFKEFLYCLRLDSIYKFKLSEN